MYLQTLTDIENACGTDICYVMCIGYHASQKLSVSFQPIDIIDKVEALRESELVSPEGWVNSLYGVAKDFGLDVAYDKKALADYEALDNELEIQKWKWLAPSGKTFVHFVAARKGIIIFDPMGDSNVCKYGYLHSKRIIGLKAT